MRGIAALEAGMNTDDLDRLLRLMLTRGFSEIDMTDGGERIRLRLPATSGPQSPMPTASAPAPAPCILTSPSIGILLARHPLIAAPEPSEPPGDRQVTAGEAVAYIRTGLIICAVVAPSPGRVGRWLSEPGQTVGYGAHLLEFLANSATADKR